LAPRESASSRRVGARTPGDRDGRRSWSESWDYEIRRSRTRLARSAPVPRPVRVINVVGPFMQLGEPVAQAALAEGCHYSTPRVSRLGDVPARALRRGVRAKVWCCVQRTPSCGGGSTRVETLLEDDGIDSFDLIYSPNGSATIASTLSFLRMCTKPSTYWPTMRSRHGPQAR